MPNRAIGCKSRDNGHTRVTPLILKAQLLIPDGQGIVLEPAVVAMAE